MKHKRDIIEWTIATAMAIVVGSLMFAVFTLVSCEKDSETDTPCNPAEAVRQQHENYYSEHGGLVQYHEADDHYAYIYSDHKEHPTEVVEQLGYPRYSNYVSVEIEPGNYWRVESVQVDAGDRVLYNDYCD